MKAIVFYKQNDIRYEKNWPDPKQPNDNEVMIATIWAGICGTDIEDYRFGGVIPVTKPHPITGRMAPMVIGHEYVGRVVALGRNVIGLSIGQTVAVECVKGCKTCYWCKKQEYALCQNMVSIGQQDDGGMAEYFIAPAENCIPIPLGNPVAHFVMAEPLAVMIRALRKGRMKIGDTVTIVGAGAIGLCGIAAARVAGAEKIISVNHGGIRAKVALELGATYSFDSNEEGWMDKFLHATDFLKADLVIDTGGNIPAMRLAYDLTKRGGRCVFASVVDDYIPIPALDIMLGEKEIIGSVAHTHLEEFKWAVQYIADGRFNPEPIITDRVYIENAVEDGFNRIIKDRNQIKIIVSPQKELI
jgi:(R,R)-butanediol dehydrogenase/meso-butanediol dehydrogenase/diacetyl reductase